jgi:hypothetical protein
MKRLIVVGNFTAHLGRKNNYHINFGSITIGRFFAGKFKFKENMQKRFFTPRELIKMAKLCDMCNQQLTGLPVLPKFIDCA